MISGISQISVIVRTEVPSGVHHENGVGSTSGDLKGDLDISLSSIPGAKIDRESSISTYIGSNRLGTVVSSRSGDIPINRFPINGSDISAHSPAESIGPTP